MVISGIGISTFSGIGTSIFSRIWEWTFYRIGTSTFFGIGIATLVVGNTILANLNLFFWKIKHFSWFSYDLQIK